MNGTSDIDRTRPRRHRSGRLWFGLIGGGVAWAVHFMACYIIAEFGCVAGAPRGTFMGISAIAWLLIVVTGVALATALAATASGLRGMGRAGEVRGMTEEPRRFLGRMGAVTSGLFTVVVAVQAMPVFFHLEGC